MPSKMKFCVPKEQTRLLSCVRTSFPDDVRHMGHGGTRCSADVQHLTAGLHVDITDATNDARSKFGSERVPHTILFLVSRTFNLEG